MNHLEQPEAWVIFIMCLSTLVLYLPEPLVIISRGFRFWIKGLIGTNKEDFRDFVMTYLIFWILRAAFHAIQWMIFFKIDLFNLIALLLGTAGSMLGANIIKRNITGNKND